jgi:hypothetical protein
VWLRNLSESEHVAFIASHPDLAAERQRRDHGSAGRRISAAGDRGPGSVNHPDLWAGFVAVGA